MSAGGRSSAAPLCTIAYLWVLPLEATSLAARWAQNFEAYEGGEEGTASSEGRGRWARADPNFIGYTYKAWEAVSPPPGGHPCSCAPGLSALLYDYVSNT